MQLSVTPAAWACALLAVTLTTACSGGSPLAPPTPGANLRPSGASIRPDAVPCNSGQAPAKVYVTHAATNSIDAYNQSTLNPANTSTFTGLSSPIGIDVHGTRLYVANYNSQTIQVYNKCGGPPLATLPDSSGYTTGVALDAAGNLYATNWVDNAGAPGEVRYYASATGSGITIGDPLLTDVGFVTVDQGGDVFVGGTSNNGTSYHIDWCQNTPANHCKLGGASWHNTGIPLNYLAGGLRIDANGRLVVSQQYANISVYTIPGFVKIASYPCPGGPGQASDCADFGFNQGGNRLFIGDYGNGEGWRVDYPSFNAPASIGAPAPGSQDVHSAAAWPGPVWGG